MPLRLAELDLRRVNFFGCVEFVFSFVPHPTLAVMVLAQGEFLNWTTLNKEKTDGREITRGWKSATKQQFVQNSRFPSRSSSSPDDSMVMFEAASFCLSLFLALLLLLHPAESLGQSSRSSNKGSSKLELGRILARGQFF